ncbi:bifunctional (p)ppGpp synthetase/guanosine-3',5'-bis(diphosphate) 3'-pyrophosphohydrolase [Candidatus Woesearchaeota archaeon]|nr:bifunctional (p)ppGpp synthetase/guanosine-3',5'-bis(diphosphate) 3'-pyrophosphohydrolase [Candidatus Woesearchaeota archaeon]
MDSELRELMDAIKEYDLKADFSLIEKAYHFAKKAHSGQKRLSGKDYFVHPVEVAKILIEWRADTASICAALLHDVVEDSKIDIKIMEKEFGKEIAQIVEGETKLRKIVFQSRDDYTAENIRKVLLATTKDIRVILIKLADRLHNMRTLKYFNKDKQKRISRETIDIYAPLAHKLGMYSLKGELEDLSLRYLESKVYQDLKKKIKEKRKSREVKAKILMGMIREKLKENNLEFIEVSGRAKYFYSIYKKMLREKKTFDEIYDLIAVRVIVKTIPECYKVLALIHQIWKPIPGRLKDYIAVPKSNGYQSLHTDVVSQFGSILEVQIRTLEMHYIAKYGVAAHWRYKGTERDKKFDKRISWLEQILDWKKKAPSEFLESLKVDLFQDEIVVFTPKGDPIILPDGSTPIDFAYEVHTGVGDHCVKAEVNNKLVSFDTRLKSGDIVKIITSNSARPSRNWLSFVKTNKAKTKIRSALGVEIDLKDQKETTDLSEEIDIKKYITYEGKKAPLKISRCCNPKFQDNIIAFKTKDKTITIHKTECPNIHSLDPSKRVNVKWSVPDKDIKEVIIYTEDKIGLIENILDTLIKSKLNVLSINVKDQKQKIQLTLKIKAEDLTLIENTENILKKIKFVKTVKIK